MLGGASGHPPFFLDGGRTMRITRCTMLGLALLLVACGEGGVDWNAPENLVLREKNAKVGEGVQLEYWSLVDAGDRKSTRLNSSHVRISYAVFCLKKQIR